MSIHMDVEKSPKRNDLILILEMQITEQKWWEWVYVQTFVKLILRTEITKIYEWFYGIAILLRPTVFCGI